MVSAKHPPFGGTTPRHEPMSVSLEAGHGVGRVLCFLKVSVRISIQYSTVLYRSNRFGFSSRITCNIPRPTSHNTMSLAVNLTSSTTMLGVVYSGEPYNVDVVELPRPSLLADTDAIVKIKIAGICGTDMHMYHGLRGAGARWGLGHEALGVVSEIGSAVSSLAIGDYVVIPDNVDSGHLDMEPAVVDVFGVGRGLDGLQGKQDIPTIVTR
jgi:hypothetical protein